MKISQIEIKDYNQFKNFTLDLTYPAGHEKAGKPLDKVCIIGQSGTGKTSLLNICNEFRTFEAYASAMEMIQEFQIAVTIDYKDILKEKKLKFLGEKERSVVIRYKNDNKILTADEVIAILEQTDYPSNGLIKTIFFPAETIYNINQILESQPLQNPLNYLSTDEIIKRQIVEERKQLAEKSIYDFGKDNPAEIWKAILIDSSNYMVEELSFSQKITKALVKDINKANELVEQFKQWKETNPNPIKELADKCLNPILNKFQLEVKTDFDFEKAEDLKFIKIQTLNGQEVPYGNWSTGTKHIIFKATPLYKLNTNKTIVLMDEPETSLYPDIQTMIVNYSESSDKFVKRNGCTRLWHKKLPFV